MISTSKGYVKKVNAKLKAFARAIRYMGLAKKEIPFLMQNSIIATSYQWSIAVLITVVLKVSSMSARIDAL